MTIAIGLLAKNGVVIAADTQETIGSSKLTQSKIVIANRGIPSAGAGALAVSGAGWSTFLDSANQELCEEFVDAKHSSAKELTGEIKNRIKKFHRDHIVPLAVLRDRPVMSLVIGAHASGTGHLWVTDESTVWKSHNYGVVGIGTSYARGMLDRYYMPRMELDAATLLAVYVMFNVKRTIDGCGDKTQIVMLKDGFATFVSETHTERIEAVFEEQAILGNLQLHFVIGPPSKNDDQRLTEFRETLQELRDRISHIQMTDTIPHVRGVRRLDHPEYRPDPK